jgi:DnaJ-class molecular chaperone
MLGKFYKILAKKYHPDSNPDIDTSAEIILINKLKKSWRV